jgi:hypothetical protein
MGERAQAGNQRTCENPAEQEQILARTMDAKKALPAMRTAGCKTARATREVFSWQKTSLQFLSR